MVVADSPVFFSSSPSFSTLERRVYSLRPLCPCRTSVGIASAAAAADAVGAAAARFPPSSTPPPPPPSSSSSSQAAPGGTNQATHGKATRDRWYTWRIWHRSVRPHHLPHWPRIGLDVHDLGGVVHWNVHTYIFCRDG